MAAGDVSNWMTTPNTSWVSTPMSNPHHPSDEIPLVYSTTYPYTGYPTGASPVQTIGSIQFRDGFLGGYGTNRGFAGEFPGNVQDAIKCSWSHARRGSYGGQWWTEDLGPDGSTGPGVCAPISGAVNSTNSGDHDVGIYASSSAIDAGGHQTVSFAVRCTLMRLSITTLLSKFGPDAGAGIPDDNPFLQADIEWEDDRPELLGIDLAPDESTTDTNPDSYQITWYIDVPPNPESSGSGWGPYPDAAQFIGAPDGPENYVGGLHPAMTLTYGSHSAAGWTEVDPSMIAAARTRESDASFGIRAVCLMPKMLNDALPFSFAGIGVDHAEYRSLQTLALRIRQSPARHRWIDTTEEPPPVVEGQGDIARSSTHLSKGGYWT